MNATHILAGTEPAPHSGRPTTTRTEQGLSDIPFIRSRSPRGPNPKGAILLATYEPRPRGDLPERYALKVKDDAMAPMAQCGDVIWVSSALDPEPGHCVVIGTDFGGELRQFEPRDNAPPLYCALNPEYEDVDAAAERVWICGVVVGVVPVAAQA